MYDDALERNRRVAWARYYEARRELDAAALLAAELAEWLGPDVPPAAAQAAEMARSAVGPFRAVSAPRVPRNRKSALSACPDYA
jgi:hypothetical protein